LLIFFQMRNPASYVSLDWLVFVAFGAVAGYFIRFEQPVIKAIAVREICRSRKAYRVDIS
jgi:hypothetical protein